MKIESSYELTINGEEYTALRKMLNNSTSTQMQKSGLTPTEQQLLMDMLSEMLPPDD